MFSLVINMLCFSMLLMSVSGVVFTMVPDITNNYGTAIL